MPSREFRYPKVTPVPQPPPADTAHLLRQRELVIASVLALPTRKTHGAADRAR